MEHFEIIESNRPDFYAAIIRADMLCRLYSDKPQAVEDRVQALAFASDLLSELRAAYLADLRQMQDDFNQVADGQTPERWQ